MKKILFLLLISINISANESERKGLEIAKKAEKINSGWVDSQVQMKMTLINRKGQRAFRNIRNKTLEVQNDGDKSMSIFDTPRDIKGTAMLTFSHNDRADEQWIYLPALKRVKRISSRNKSGPFMGSEFAYEDLSSQEIEKYKYFYIGDEVINKIDSFKVKRIPAYKHSGYTKQIVWIDKKLYIPLKIEFYDRKKSLLKTLEFKEYKKYINKFWRADKTIMTNHQNGKSTILTREKYKFKTGLKNSDFQSNKLKRQK